MDILKLINSYIIYAYVIVGIIILILLIMLWLKTSGLIKHLNNNISQVSEHVEDISESIKLTSDKFKQSISGFKKAFIIFTFIYLTKKDYKQSDKKSLTRSMFNGAKTELLANNYLKIK